MSAIAECLDYVDQFVLKYYRDGIEPVPYDHPRGSLLIAGRFKWRSEAAHVEFAGLKADRAMLEWWFTHPTVVGHLFRYSEASGGKWYRERMHGKDGPYDSPRAAIKAAMEATHDIHADTGAHQG